MSCSPQSTITITLVSRRPGDQGFASPVLFVIGGWLYMEGRMVEAGDEVVGVQGIAGEIGFGLAIQLASVSRTGN